jgi:hypothetical protein
MFPRSSEMGRESVSDPNRSASSSGPQVTSMCLVFVCFGLCQPVKLIFHFMQCNTENLRFGFVARRSFTYESSVPRLGQYRSFWLTESEVTRIDRQEFMTFTSMSKNISREIALLQNVEPTPCISRLSFNSHDCRTNSSGDKSGNSPGCP